MVTIGAGRRKWLGAGSKDDRDKQTDNRVHTRAGDREDVASCSRFPHSALDSGHSLVCMDCQLRAGPETQETRITNIEAQLCYMLVYFLLILHED